MSGKLPRGGMERGAEDFVRDIAAQAELRTPLNYRTIAHTLSDSSTGSSSSPYLSPATRDGSSSSSSGLLSLPDELLAEFKKPRRRAADLDRTPSTEEIFSPSPDPRKHRIADMASPVPKGRPLTSANKLWEEKFDKLSHEKQEMELRYAGEIRSLKSRLREQESTLSQKGEEIEQLQQQLADSNRRSERLLDGLNNGLFISSERYNELRRVDAQQLQPLDVIRLRVHEAVQPLKQQIGELQSDLESALNVATDTADLSETKHQQLVSRMHVAENKVKTLTANIHRLEEENTALLDRLGSEKARLAEYRDKGAAYDNLLARNKELQLQVEELLVKGNRQDREAEDLRAERDQLRLQLDRAKDEARHAAENSRSKADARVDAEINLLQQARERELTEIRENSRALYERENAMLRTNYEDATLRYNRLNTQYEALQRQHDDLVKEHRRSTLENETALSELRSNLKVKSFELERITAAYEERGQSLETAKLETECSHEKVRIIREEYSKLERDSLRRITELETRLSHSESRLLTYDQLETELDQAVLEAGRSAARTSGMLEGEEGPDVAQLLGFHGGSNDGAENDEEEEEGKQGVSTTWDAAGAANQEVGKGKPPSDDRKAAGGEGSQRGTSSDTLVSLLSSGLPTSTRRRVRQCITLAQRLVRAEAENSRLARKLKATEEKLRKSEEEREGAEAALHRTTQPQSYLVEVVRTKEKEFKEQARLVQQLQQELVQLQEATNRAESRREQAEADLKNVMHQRLEIEAMYQALATRAATAVNQAPAVTASAAADREMIQKMINDAMDTIYKRAGANAMSSGSAQSRPGSTTGQQRRKLKMSNGILQFEVETKEASTRNSTAASPRASPRSPGFFSSYQAPPQGSPPYARSPALDEEFLGHHHFTGHTQYGTSSTEPTRRAPSPHYQAGEPGAPLRIHAMHLPSSAHRPVPSSALPAMGPVPAVESCTPDAEDDHLGGFAQQFEGGQLPRWYKPQRFAQHPPGTSGYPSHF